MRRKRDRRNRACHRRDGRRGCSVDLCYLFINVLAALIFPTLGAVLGLSNEGFGLFAGTAINDTSSVTAAAAAWDGIHASHTLETATIVKMTRTLAIIPITLALAFYREKRRKKKKALLLASRSPSVLCAFFHPCICRNNNIPPSCRSHRSS